MKEATGLVNSKLQIECSYKSYFEGSELWISQSQAVSSHGPSKSTGSGHCIIRVASETDFKSLASLFYGDI